MAEEEEDDEEEGEPLPSADADEGGLKCRDWRGVSRRFAKLVDIWQHFPPDFLNPVFCHSLTENVISTQS